MRLQSMLFFTVLALVAGGSPAVWADDPSDIDPVPAPAGQSSGGGTGGSAWDVGSGATLKLSLQDAIERAMVNNLGVQVQRFNPLIAEEDLRIAWGTYDPIWESDFGWEQERIPTSSGLQGSNISAGKTLGGEGGFVGLLPFLSTQYSVKLASSRDVSNFRFQGLSPEFRSTTSFSFTQPLLRDLIWNEPWTRVKVTNILHAASVEAFRLDLMDIVAGTEDAYWRLIATHEEMVVAEKSLETAEALLNQTQIQYEVGVISKVEVVEAEAGVADREFRLIVARNNYRQSQDRLIDLVLGEQLRPETTLAIEPTDSAEEYVTYEIDVSEATNVAMENRPELVLANQEIERLSVQKKFAKNQRLPRLDIQTTYFYQGLSGTPTPCVEVIEGDGSCDDVIPTTNYGHSYDNFYSGPFHNWNVRGVFSIPIPNTSARHRYTQAQIELRQAETRKRRVEQDIVLEIRTAARNIDASQQGIEAAKRGSAAAAEQLRAERIRLEYGESTPFDVLLREDELVRAESQKITAFESYRRSLTALDRRQGTILRSRNIAIDDVMTLR